MSALPTIEVQLTGGAQAALAKLADPRALAAALVPVMDRQNALTVSHIRRRYLSFPFTKRIAGRVEKQSTTMEGLRIRTGRLRGSIRAAPATVAGDGVTSSIGTNVAYAGIHEFGGRIQMPARARRIHFVEGRFSSASAFKKDLKKFANAGTRRVLAYGRAYTINMPQRSFLRRGIADRVKPMSLAVSNAIVRFARAQGGPA